MPLQVPTKMQAVLGLVEAPLVITTMALANQAAFGRTTMGPGTALLIFVVLYTLPLLYVHKHMQLLWAAFQIQQKQQQVRKKECRCRQSGDQQQTAEGISSAAEKPFHSNEMLPKKPKTVPSQSKIVVQPQPRSSSVRSCSKSSKLYQPHSRPTFLSVKVGLVLSV